MVQHGLFRRLPVTLAVVVATVGGLAVSLPAQAASAANPACPWVGQHASPEQRAAEVLAQMTMAEKITMVHGDSYVALRGSDPGHRRPVRARVEPGGRPRRRRRRHDRRDPAARAGRRGRQLGSVAGPAVRRRDRKRAVGQGRQRRPRADGEHRPRPALGPRVRVLRRGPLPAGQIGAADIQGRAGHRRARPGETLAVYNQETNRNTATDNAIIIRPDDERDLPAAVPGGRPAGRRVVGHVLLQHINGSPACQDDYTQNQVLKDEWQLPRLHHLRLGRDALHCGRPPTTASTCRCRTTQFFGAAARPRPHRRSGAAVAAERHGHAHPHRGVPLRPVRPAADRVTVHCGHQHAARRGRQGHRRAGHRAAEEHELRAAAVHPLHQVDRGDRRRRGSRRADRPAAAAPAYAAPYSSRRTTASSRAPAAA